MNKDQRTPYFMITYNKKNTQEKLISIYSENF